MLNERVVAAPKFSSLPLYNFTLSPQNITVEVGFDHGVRRNTFIDEFPNCFYIFCHFGGV